MANRDGTSGACRIAIGIATSGRREVLKAVLPHLALQERRPDEVIICAAAADDVDVTGFEGSGLPVRVLVAERGLCLQRNHILRGAQNADILLFLDDDFIMAPTYVGEVERIFTADPQVVMATGTVDADGITGPGLELSEALAIIARGVECAAAGKPLPVYNAYGCNMAIRMATTRAHGVFFDENLPLYGWLEDVDFSRRMARHGKIVRSERLRGVHMGTKSGRTSGLRFGYSQVANPIYLMRKRTMSFGRASAQMARNLAANIARLPVPEPWVDRRGRFRGNVRALADLLRGRLSPRNVLVLE